MINLIVSERSKLAQKEYKTKHAIDEGDPLGIEIWSEHQMVYTHSRIHPREWDAKYFLRFCDTNGSLNPAWETRRRGN